MLPNPVTSKTLCAMNGQPHFWDNWKPYTKEHGEYLAEPPYVYRRECTSMGCGAYQLAEELVPVGKVHEVNSHTRVLSRDPLRTDNPITESLNYGVPVPPGVDHPKGVPE